MPAHASAAGGTRIHTQFERYLNGQSLDYSSPLMREAAERATPGIVNLPLPLSAGALVECAFTFEVVGVGFRGFMDLVVPNSYVIPGCEGGVPGVVDHKSTSSFRYLKTPEVLRTDVQAMIYAYKALTLFPELPPAPGVDLVWNYVATRGASKTQRTHLRVIPEHIVSQVKGPIAETALELVATYVGRPRALDLPPSTDHCDAYGGCPYKSLCTDLHCGPLGHLTPEEESTMTQSGIDLFTRLEVVKAQEDKKTILPPGITDAPAGYVPMPFLLPLPQQTKPEVEEVVAINPPEWQPPPTPEQRAAAATEAPAAPIKVTRKRRTKAEITADDALAPNSPEAMARRASIAAINEMVAGTEKAIPDAYDTSPATIPAPRPYIPPKEFASGDGAWPDVKRFTLYVDCAPNGYHVDASVLFYRAKEIVHKNLEVADYRFVDYGKGQGALVVAVNHLLDSETYTDIVVDSRTPEAALCLAGMTARAGHVVRGFR